MPRMKNAGDGDAVGLFDDVGAQRVQQDEGQDGEADGGPAAARRRTAEIVTATAPETIMARIPVA